MSRHKPPFASSTMTLTYETQASAPATYPHSQDELQRLAADTWSRRRPRPATRGRGGMQQSSAIADCDTAIGSMGRSPSGTPARVPPSRRLPSAFAWLSGSATGRSFPLSAGAGKLSPSGRPAMPAEHVSRGRADLQRRPPDCKRSGANRANTQRADTLSAAWRSTSAGVPTAALDRLHGSSGYVPSGPDKAAPTPDYVDAPFPSNIPALLATRDLIRSWQQMGVLRIRYAVSSRRASLERSLFAAILFNLIRSWQALRSVT